MEKNDTEDSEFYRWILKEEYDYIFDDEVLELLDFFKQYEQLNKYLNYKYYGRRIIKYRRDW